MGQLKNLNNNGKAGESPNQATKSPSHFKKFDQAEVSKVEQVPGNGGESTKRNSNFKKQKSMESTKSSDLFGSKIV